MSRVFVYLVIPLLVCGLPSSNHVCDDACGNLPKSRDVLCAIIPPFYGTFYEECNSYSESDGSCEVYVGMNVVLDCSNTTADTQMYKNGEPLGNGGSFTIPYVQMEDEGLYECKTTADGIVQGQRNVTVKAEALVAVGQVSTRCSSFYCGEVVSKGGCCTPMNAWIPSRVGAEFSINVYGKAPVDITVETIWTDHYPVDLQIQVSGDNSTTEKKLVLGAKPFTVQHGLDPAPIIVVNATNSYGSSAACFQWFFLDSQQILYVDTSLPSNKTASIGESVTFTCWVAVEWTSAFIAGVEIEYIPTIGAAPLIECKSGYQCECLSDSCPVRIITTRNDTYNIVRYTYDIAISNVTAADDGGTVSCALKYKDVIQWKGTAWLSVTPVIVTTPTPSVTPATDGGTLETDKVLYTAIAPSLFAILLVAIIMTFVIVWSRKLRLEKTRRRSNDSVPLNSAYTLSTSSSLSEEMDTVLSTHPPLPAIEVTGTPLGGSPRPISTQSLDSGVIQEGSISSSLEEDAFPINNTHLQVRHYIGAATRTQFNVLGAYVPKERSLSLSDLLDTPSSYGRRQLRIYVSYSDFKAGWVLGYLKPLIESYQNTVVSIHEADMIAGHPISEERLRLIIEADKVVIVCSPDYSTSPWCQYELYQAITKQPSLAQGRIIPVLCDGCTSVPNVIKSVVTLRDCDETFKEKLRAAIFRIHRSSH